ncbi:hypothetical protein KPL50_17420 [Clostridium sp. CF012]|nr:hypothetical protein [Clostridium sp. CF012]
MYYVLQIPLLLISNYFTRKGSFKGKLLLTGTLGYFLYTFMSYTFLWMYNKFFIIYVLLMSLSLFGFILAMMSFDIDNIALNFKKQLPVKLIGGFQLFLAFAIGMLWLGKIEPSIFKGITKLTCISAMIINLALNNVKMSIIEIVIFPMFNLLAIICLIILMKNTIEPNNVTVTR